MGIHGVLQEQIEIKMLKGVCAGDAICVGLDAKLIQNLGHPNTHTPHNTRYAPLPELSIFNL